MEKKKLLCEIFAQKWKVVKIWIRLPGQRKCCILFATYVYGQLNWECDLQHISIKQDGIFLSKSFQEQTSHSLTKAQLKNKWDGCKKDWKIWTKLLSETGVGWSSELGTIAAMNEWWTTKIQEVKGARKFRHAGIEPALKFKYDRMYSSIVATGEYAWAPSSGVQGGGNCSQPGTNDANIDAMYLEEGSGDLEEDGNHASDNDIAHLVGGVNISSSNNTRSSGKRKEMEADKGRAKKKSKKSASIGVQLMSKWGDLVDSMSTRSDSTSLHMVKQGCSIHEVMAEIHSILGIRADIDFHDFASEFMLQRKRREMCYDGKS